MLLSLEAAGLIVLCNLASVPFLALPSGGLPAWKTWLHTTPRRTQWPGHGGVGHPWPEVAWPWLPVPRPRLHTGGGADDWPGRPGPPPGLTPPPPPGPAHWRFPPSPASLVPAGPRRPARFRGARLAKVPALPGPAGASPAPAPPGPRARTAPCGPSGGKPVEHRLGPDRGRGAAIGPPATIPSAATGLAWSGSRAPSRRPSSAPPASRTLADCQTYAFSSPTMRFAASSSGVRDASQTRGAGHCDGRGGRLRSDSGSC